MIECFICHDVIVEYGMDLGDTVSIDTKNGEAFICNACSKSIALQLINNFGG